MRKIRYTGPVEAAGRNENTIPEPCGLVLAEAGVPVIAMDLGS